MMGSHPEACKPLRVLFCVVALNMGGISKVLMEYLSHLRNFNSIRCSILCLEPIREKWILEKLAEFGVEYTDSFMMPAVNKYTFFLIKWYLKFRRHRQKKILPVKLRKVLASYDLLIDFGNMQCKHFLLNIGKPVFGWCHSSYPAFALNTAQRAGLTGYDKVICLSNSFKADYKNQHPEDHVKWECLYNPIDIEAVRRAAEESIQIEEGDYFVAVQRLAKDKSTDTIVEAFIMYVKTHPKTLLYIVGDGLLRPYLEKQAKNCPQIVFTGQIDNPYPLIKCAKALILSSTKDLGEGLPHVLLEAQALGVPCIASDVKSGTGEILLQGKAGYLFEPENTNALFEAMCKIDNDPIGTKTKVCEAMAALGRFAPDSISNKFLTLLDSLYSNKRIV